MRAASTLRHVGWWAADYAYAGVRQLAILTAPWPVGRRRRAPDAWAKGSPNLPEVILLPGVYEHWSFLRPLGNALNAAGYRVSVVHGLGINRRSVIETSDRLGRALVQRPASASGRVLVAHSKGGLIGKHLLIESGAATTHGAQPLALRGLVAVCTPFGGSPLARLLLDPSIRAFLPTDETIITLGRDSSINGRIVSVFGRYDPHIPGGSALDGATNVRVDAVGHFRILASPLTHRAVLDGLAFLAAD